MIIKCPECGHQVSDRAPLCPSCGVEIAGHIIKCSHCGEIHFKSDITCPNCHHNLLGTSQQTETTPEPTPTAENPEEEEPLYEAKVIDTAEEELEEEDDEQQDDEYDQDSRTNDEDEELPSAEPIQDSTESNYNKPEKRRGGTVTLVISFLIAAITCAVLLYLYRDAQDAQEREKYEEAITKKDPAFLQMYLDNFRDKNPEHTQEITMLLARITIQKDKKVVSKEEPQQDTTDETDWQRAKQENTDDAYASYLAKHPQGKHKTEAEEAIKQNTRATLVTDEDKARAKAAIQKMLRAMNGHNAEQLTATLAPTLTYDGKEGQTPQAAIDYMNHLYNKVSRMNWYLDQGDPQVTKTADQTLTIVMPARLSQNLESGGNAQNNFNIRATLSPDGRISALSFIKLAPTEQIKKESSDKKS